ncbi:hypothetical protein ACHAWT_010159 [Skeletonema menzelii]
MQQQSSSPPPLHPPRPPLVNRGSSDGSRGTKHSTNNIVSFKDLARSPKQTSQQHNISVDTVVSSQFENEAETHILAALEIEERDQSNLLGEGIDVTGAMDDYSDDEDDENLYPGGEAGAGSGRSRTYSTDSFLKRVHMQNDQPQYHYEVESTSSPNSSSQQQQHQHKRYLSSNRGSGYLPSVPDDAVLCDYLERNDYDHDKDSSFLEAVHPGEDDDTNSNNIDGKSDTKGDGTASAFGETNTTTTTNATENVTTMAKRLAQLQRRSSVFSKRMSSSSATSSSEFLSDRRGGDNATSHDKLIDALGSVDSSSRGWFGKIRYEWNLLIVPKLPTFRKQISHVLLFLVFPSLAVASVLFYMFDNPMAGDTGTSISWWIIFVGARQAMTMGLARIGQVFWVEILALRSRLFNTIVGPYVSLAIIQSSGWPYNICFWAVLDFCLLFGNFPFPRHWLFWQNKLDIFNGNNPVEGVTSSNGYMRLLFTCIFIGIAASLKRLFLAVYLGRRTVAHFNAEMEKVFAKMILIGEIAALAKEIENRHEGFRGTLVGGPDDDEKLVRFREIFLNDSCGSSAEGSPRKSSPSRPGGRKVLTEPLESNGDSPEVSQGSRKIHQQGDESSHDTRESRQKSSFPDTSMSDGAGKTVYSAASTNNIKLMTLLEEWEEPELASSTKSVATVKDLVNFRKAVSYMDDKYPFSHAFGLANTRELTITSAQAVYDRLMLAASDHQVLPFSTLAVLATAPDGTLIDGRIKSLIKLLRPDRQGNLTKLDFVKSIDEVYKQQRLLRASISSSNRIDNAFEKIVNCFFYFFLAIIGFTILGWANVWTVFLSFNTFFLGFSFLFGAAASNYFEGLLLIFVRRPYDIGDKIATSNPKSDTSPDGSSTWYVDNVTLFTTTVRFATTNEVATYSNGSIAQLRIINANRSPKAVVSVLIKFGLETPFNKVTVFRAAVENFIKARPREWIALSGFRATSVEADFGYVEYKIIAQHREKWQNMGAILQSKADLSSFILEVTKKLDMKYESPPMPVNLSAAGNMNIQGLFADEGNVEPRSGLQDVNVSAEDLEEVANMFEVRKT